MSDCPDCGARPGELHDEVCDIPHCPETGEQRLVCRYTHDCPPVVWHGAEPIEVVLSVVEKQGDERLPLTVATGTIVTTGEAVRLLVPRAARPGETYLWRELTDDFGPPVRVET